MQQRRVKILGLVAGFICMISFPLLNQMLGMVKDSKNLENRALALKPEFNLDHLDPFPEKYEKFYNDYFTIRSLTVRFFGDLNTYLFKKSPFPDRVVLGYNQWLYLRGNINCYLGTNRLNDDQLKRWKKRIESQKEYIEQKGGKFYFLIAPDKSSIYSENIPYFYYRINNEPIGEQLNNYLLKSTNVNVISLYNYLGQKKDPKNIYYKLDNHWNSLGGCYAANYVRAQIAKDFPKVTSFNVSDYVITTTPVTDGDIWNIIGKPNFYSDVEYHLNYKGKPIWIDDRNYAYEFVRKRVSSDTTKPNIVILGDSFTNSFFPFMEDGFGKSYHVFDFWKYLLPKEIIDEVNPEIYIFMIYEGHLINVPND
jgi:hypothetical protein